jgi:rSAM/selenodomain-associated transferase 2
MRLSVVIPAWNEASTIAEAVGCARAFADEVVVVDAHSPDGTCAVAQAAGATVLQAPRGRGLQLCAGASAAKGDVLLFLHADGWLPPDARGAIAEALGDPRVLGGNFRLRFDGRGWATSVFSWLNDLRRRWLRIYYGDSAIFVRREVYQALGGFRPIPLLEDYEFVRRLERRGQTAYVRQVVVRASARRFARRPLWTVLVWVLVQSLYSAGVAPARLARLYSDLR